MLSESQSQMVQETDSELKKVYFKKLKTLENRKQIVIKKDLEKSDVSC